MIFFILLQLVILVIIVYLFYLLSWFWPPDSPWAPWWKTSAEVARAIQKLGKITSKDLVYELGSGDCENLITLAKEFDIPSVGIEVDPWRVTQSKVLIFLKGLSKKITIIKKNLFAVDISKATVVYIYLIPKTLEKLQTKLEKELKPGTKVISYRYPILYLPKIGENKTHKLYLYEVPAKKSPAKTKK